MKFTVSSTLLNNRLQTLAKVLSSKNSMPILDCFLFEIIEGSLKITASDSENLMTSTLPLDESEGDSRFAVPSKNILDAVRELPEQPLLIDVNTETLNANVLYQNGKYNFTLQNADEYPVFQDLQGESDVITIDSGILANNISRSLFATATGNLRPLMNGLFFDQREDYLAVVASDGHKLVETQNFNLKSGHSSSFILPKKPASLLKNVLGKDGGDVVIRFNTNGAKITFADGILVCRLSEGKYPNYESVIPKDNPNKTNINRIGLLSALRRVLPFASESSELVRINLSMGNLQLQSEDVDFSTSAKEDVVCEYDGPKMSIGFKGGTLVEILSNLESDEVTILLGDPSRAGVILPTDQPADAKILMLVMPMLLNE
jgi:DNA polymerase-3 subunit beta